MPTPLGKAIPFTPEQITEQSEVTDSDIIFAILLWAKYAPRAYRDLIGADPLYEWDAKRRQYYTAGGVYIDSLTLRNRAVEPFLVNVHNVMRGLSFQLQAKEISLADWQQSMAQLVKYSQIAAALVANGGSLNTTPKDYLTIILFIASMLAFLLAFAQEIESGEQVMNGYLLSRTDLYAWAGRDAYEEMRRYGMQEYTDNDQERRVLDPNANHCVPGIKEDGRYWESCPELAEKGWQAIGTLPRLMDTPCLVNCRCHFEYRTN